MMSKTQTGKKSRTILLLQHFQWRNEPLNQTARNGNRSSRKRTGTVYGLQAEGCVKALWEERRQSRGPVSHKSTSTSEFIWRTPRTPALRRPSL